MNRIVGELLTQSWVAQLFQEVSERQTKSLQRVQALQEVDSTSPVFWPFHAPQMPLCVTEARGCRIKDLDGNEYLDVHLGWGSQALHGHTPASVVDFVRQQLGSGTGNGYFNPVELELARLLKKLMPHCEKFAFLNSGTDATSAAIRLARAHTGRHMVAKVEGSLHGISDLVTHNTAFWYHGNPTHPFPAVGERGVVPTASLRGVHPAGPRDILVLPHNEQRAFELIERHRNELACVIAEPVSSSFPFEDKSIPFVRKLSETARRMRVPFILDEVLTGFRCGISGASAEHQIPADMITYGKVITGLGLPLSAVGGRAEFLDFAQTSGMALTDFGNKTCLNTTHMGNHLSLAASLASLRLLQEKGERYYVETRAKVTRLKSRLQGFREEHGIPLQLVGFGDFIGAFTFIEDKPLDNFREFAGAINPIGLYLLSLLLRKRGVYCFSMPIFFTGGAHAPEDLDELYTKVTDAALEMQRHQFPFVLPG